MRFILFVNLLFVFPSFINSQTNGQTLVYKNIDTIELQVEYHLPIEELDTAGVAIAWFHGGGWKGGNVGQFREHSKYLARRGIASFSFEYRIERDHGTTPFESLKDAKSAIRWLRSHASEFNVNPDLILTGGGSAGGHLAAATTLVPGFDDPNDDLSISTKSKALLLFNPVLDSGPGRYGYDRIGDQHHQFSPINHITEGAPPTIIFVGTEDNVLPIEMAQYFRMIMERVKSRCELDIYPGRTHGFFNVRRDNGHDHKLTLISLDRFLVSLGYLSGSPF